MSDAQRFIFPAVNQEGHTMREGQDEYVLASTYNALLREVEALKTKLYSYEGTTMYEQWQAAYKRAEQLERQVAEAQQRISVVQEERDVERRRYEDSLERITELEAELGH